MITAIAVSYTHLDVYKRQLSLYLEVNADYTIAKRESKVERIHVAENLRHDTLEPYFNEETLSADSGHPYWANLLFLFNLSEALEKARGKYDPSKPPQIDYNFYVNEGIVSIIAVSYTHLYEYSISGH